MYNLVHGFASLVVESKYLTLNFQTKSIFLKIHCVSFLGSHWLENEPKIGRVLGNLSHIHTILFLIKTPSLPNDSFVPKSVLWYEYIRVQDLSDSSFEVLPSSNCKLKHPRYLSLTSSKRMKKLPNSISKLYHLQILLLRGYERPLKNCLLVCGSLWV